MADIETKIPRQEELILATVQGETVNSLPEDLYVPPNALQILLDTFSGPLDFLLYLIKKQNLNIVDINVERVTQQYTSYIDLMEAFQIELAGDYLVMAAYLAELKSKMLLPKPKEDIQEQDPRSELIYRLQEYQRFKEVSEKLDEIPRLNRDFFSASAKLPEFQVESPLVELSLEDLSITLAEVMQRVEQSKSHLINLEQLSTRERMTLILERMKEESFIEFSSLFTLKEGRVGVVITFLAILELLKDSLIEIVQSEEFGPIHIKGIKEVH